MIPTSVTSLPPTSHMTPSTPNGLRLRGRELVMEYKNPNGDGTLGRQTLGINPLVFARLASFARGYEQFFFHTIAFTWQPSFASVNGVIGIGIDTDYNDAAPTNYTLFTQNQFSIGGLISAPQSVTYDGRVGAFARRHMVESKGANPLATQQGMLIVCSQSVGEQTAYGVKTDTSLGFVYAEYDVEFYVSQPAA